LPQLEAEIWQSYEDQGLVAFAISSSTIGPEDPVALAAYVETMGLTMTVLADYDVTVYDDYFLSDPDAFAPYPREFIVDRDGVIIYADATIDVDAISAVLDAEL
jgi:peroxiredoxin